MRSLSYGSDGSMVPPDHTVHSVRFAWCLWRYYCTFCTYHKCCTCCSVRTGARAPHIPHIILLQQEFVVLCRPQRTRIECSNLRWQLGENTCRKLSVPSVGRHPLQRRRWPDETTDPAPALPPLPVLPFNVISLPFDRVAF